MTTTVYVANSTSPQVLDTFDLAEDRMITLDIHVVSRSDSSVSQMIITTDGITTSEIQDSMSVSGARPDEITTSVNNYVGEIKCTPSVYPTTFTMVKTVTPADLYAEHTVSGKNIRHTEGVGIYFEGAANNMTARAANNNFFGDANAFVTANTLGPRMTGAELYSANSLVSFNGSFLGSNGDYTVIQSSGQHRNSQYIQLSVVPNQRYRVQANAFFVPSTVVYNGSAVQGQAAAISVGSSIAAEDIAIREVTTTETTYTIDFTATSNTVFVSYGFGVVGTELRYRTPSIKQLNPFETYNQSNGTFYFKWSAVAAGSNVAVMDSNRVFVDSSNNVFINTVNCGAQQAVNKVAYSYTSNTTIYSYNGATPVQQTATYNTEVTALSFATIPSEFSYVPVRVSNTTLIELTNG
jgi:hypothetical protein